ncbi:MAG: amino acid ABC transporter ATP-binding protein, partial [Chlorobi bacterium]|nr:amino acid ABC transporter ATP-binding protein [Chlorobiota bacterium]
ALDPELEQEVMQVMENLNKEGMTQIVVTHAMHFARGTSDKVVYLEDGKIIETGHPDVLFKDPKDPRTRAFLKTILHD